MSDAPAADGADTAPPPARRRPDPLWFVLLGVAAGVVVAALQAPRVGLFVITGAVAAGALLRLVLRPRDAGSLVVRSRQVDVATLTLVAVALGVLAAVTPFPPR